MSKKQKRGYVPQTNAVHITIYSPYGDNVPRATLDEAIEAVTVIALDNGLLIGIAEE